MTFWKLDVQELLAPTDTLSGRIKLRGITLSDFATELDLDPTKTVSEIFLAQHAGSLDVFVQLPNGGKYSRRSCIRTALTMSSSIPTHPLNFTLLPTPIVAPFPDRSVAPTPTISRCRRRRVPPLSHRHSVLRFMRHLRTLSLADDVLSYLTCLRRRLRFADGLFRFLPINRSFLIMTDSNPSATISTSVSNDSNVAAEGK
jgi:hypothetical protein